MSNKDCESTIRDLLGQLTLDEKISLLHGYDSVHIGNIPRLGILELGMLDGPQGVRLEDGRTSTALPCGIALACTWNTETAREYGALIAREVLGSGHHVSLGPGINLMRTPLNGRNFEYYGEDPVLAGRMVAGYTRGCQANRVAATPKHLALNNQEICRTVASSNVDERTLRETYLTAFEIAVTEAGPWMMMSSYNRINGAYASQCGLVQQQIVKDEFGFDGVMVSDWGGAHDAKGCALGGLDLEMGSGGRIMGKPLLEMVRAGEIPEAVIDDKVLRILRLFYRTGRFAGMTEPAAGELDTARHHGIARAVAREAMVLLKNEDAFLPLDAGSIKSIAVIGPNADYQHCMGALEICGGSGAVYPAYEITPLAGLIEYCRTRNIEVRYSPGVLFDNQSIIPRDFLSHDEKTPGLKAEYFHTADEMESGAAPFLTRINGDMHLRWSPTAMVGSNDDPELPLADFAVRWTGSLTPDRSGQASLMVDCISGQVDLSLDGEWVIRTDPKLRHQQCGCELTVEAGKPIPIVIRMACPARCYSPAELRLLWKTDAGDFMEDALEAARQSDVVIFCGGTNHFYDKEGIGSGDVPGADIPDLELIGPQAELIQHLAEVNPNIAVVLVNGSVVNVEPWIDRVRALLDTWYPGMEGGNALAEILFGDATPSGKLCCTWAKNLSDYACHANGNYPGQRDGEDPHVDYDEGIFMGYRHFDRTGIEPRFPFGFGLSYTTFEIGRPEVVAAGDSVASPEVTVRVSATNTGTRTGAEVVQLYVGDDECSAEREPKALKAFAKVTLAPGETREITLTLTWRDFAFWSPDCRQWLVEPGTFTLYVGISSRDIVDTVQIELEAKK